MDFIITYIDSLIPIAFGIWLINSSDKLKKNSKLAEKLLSKKAGWIFIAIGIIGIFLFPRSTFLDRTVNEVNKQLPIMVDEVTKVEKVTTDGKTQLTYHIRVINMSFIDFQEGSEDDKETLRQEIEESTKENVKNSMCKNKDFLKIFKKGVWLIYRYMPADIDGPIVEIKINPDFCFK